MGAYRQWVVVRDFQGDSPKVVEVTDFPHEQQMETMERLEKEYPGYSVDICGSTVPNQDPVRLLNSW